MPSSCWNKRKPFFPFEQTSHRVPFRELISPFACANGGDFYYFRILASVGFSSNSDGHGAHFNSRK